MPTTPRPSSPVRRARTLQACAVAAALCGGLLLAGARRPEAGVVYWVALLAWVGVAMLVGRIGTALRQAGDESAWRATLHARWWAAAVFLGGWTVIMLTTDGPVPVWVVYALPVVAFAPLLAAAAVVARG